jgi:predicted ATPase/DNA-binding CsgD family transcriptional regulator
MAPAAALGRAAGQRRREQQLPAEVTGFVGRKAELARLSGLLATARLVTITGPAGVGKTRVGLRAAARAASRYPDGVWFVELSSLPDPALLASAVAHSLSLDERDDAGQFAAVLDHLRTRRVLLLLDTCEHVIDACAAFAEAVLREAPGVTLLATSRQPLDVPGEHAFPVSPLPVPDQDAAAGPLAGTDLAGMGDAIELFAQRAAAAVPSFRLTVGNRPDVIRLCRRLDGIPLAIELAAVRLRALPLPELSERLENRFKVLTGGRRGVVPRHQTLRTAIEWSYDLCTPSERALWARLSVFAGTFDVAAAEEICAGPGVTRSEIVETLIGLTDKSVVLREGPRYRLLHTLREFGAGQLAADGQEAEYRQRHLSRYLALARDFRDHLLDDDQLARIHRLRREHADIGAALERALGSQAGPFGERGCGGNGSEGNRLERDGAELVTALFAYWVIAGQLQQGRYWLDRILDRFPRMSAERAEALVIRGYLGGFCGDIREAANDTSEGILLARHLGVAPAEARGYLFLNMVQTFAGWHAEAAAAGAEAERQLKKLDDRTGLALLDVHMAHLYQLTGHPHEAIKRCQQGLRHVGDSHELWLHGYLYTVGALAYFQQPGKEARCADAAAKGLRAMHELRDVIGTAYALEVLAWLAAGAGRFERAAWLAGAADPLWERAGKRLSGTAILEELHDRAVAAARDGLSEERFSTLRAQGAAHPLDEVVAAAVSDGDELCTAGIAATAGNAGQRGLTNREQEIAALVASGLSNREIAAKLVISKRTVDAHVEHIFSKLGMSSRVQLTAWLKQQLKDQLPRARESAETESLRSGTGSR